MSERMQGPIRDRSAWRGSEFTGNDSWAHHLTPDELVELDDALAAVTRADLPALECDRKSESQIFLPDEYSVRQDPGQFSR